MTNKGAHQHLGTTGAGLRLGDYALGSPLSKAAARALATARRQSEMEDDWDKPLDCTGLAERIAAARERSRQREDVLRDEGETYGRKLIGSGVEVVTARYNATIHDFVMLNALPAAAPTRAAVTQSVDFLKRRTCSEGESKTRTAFRARKRRQMRDPKEIEELEAEIARDKKRYSEIERIEGEILENISHQGFAAASQEGRFRDEKEALAETIRRNEEMLARARSQINSRADRQ
jgi:hypothetical protein